MTQDDGGGDARQKAFLVAVSHRDHALDHECFWWCPIHRRMVSAKQWDQLHQAVLRFEDRDQERRANDSNTLLDYCEYARVQSRISAEEKDSDAPTLRRLRELLIGFKRDLVELSAQPLPLSGYYIDGLVPSIERSLEDVDRLLILMGRPANAVRRQEDPLWSTRLSWADSMMFHDHVLAAVLFISGEERADLFDQVRRRVTEARRRRASARPKAR